MVDDEDDSGEEGQQPAQSEADNPADDARLQGALAALLHALLQLSVGALLRLLEEPPSLLRILVTHNPNYYTITNPPPSHLIYNSN